MPFNFMLRNQRTVDQENNPDTQRCSDYGSYKKINQEWEEMDFKVLS